MQSQTVGVVGLGLLGSGITACLLSHEFPTIVFDTDTAAAERTELHVKDSLTQLVERGVFPERILASWKTNLTHAHSLEEFQRCDFVIESIFEDFNAKQSLYDQLERVVSPQTPIASNTSSLPISLQQKSRNVPERFIGMHWAQPCHLMRFLEVIRGDQTSDDVADATIQLGAALGKDPTLVRKDVEGFIVNRLAYALYREAFWLMENGVADVQAIDSAFSNTIATWAAVAGPFRWMDLSGLPSYASVMERLFPQLSSATEVPERMKSLIASGALGIANGRGFYNYTTEEAAEWQQKLIDNAWKNTALPLRTSKPLT